ncbi:MAG: biotin/lipoyl-binding protein [Chloroflexota bacterium]|nr:MAG: biotin/lipoyl-binding protein [Chloroflexota bacterium]
MSEQQTWSSDFATLRQLLLDFETSDIDAIDVQHAGLHLRARKGLRLTCGATPTAIATAPTAAPSAPTLSVSSPLTGMVYLSPTPQAQSYVSVGDVVQGGQVVALIEAMKVFNEIRSEHAGRITRILVRSGDLVQTGQPLLELAEE